MTLQREAEDLTERRNCMDALQSDLSGRSDSIISMQDIAAEINSGVMPGEVLVLEHFKPLSHMNYFPMRIDALVITLVEKGEGILRIDLKDYEIRPNSLIVIQPKNYISFSSQCGDVSGCSIICSRDMIENVLPKLTDLLPLLMHHRMAPITTLPAHDAETLKAYALLLSRKLRENPSPFQKHKVRSLLQAALFEMMDIHQRNSPEVFTTKSRREEIMAKFLLLVSEHFRTQRQLGFYSDRLCITPKHLSAVVKGISGRTAGDWIENYVIMEAKILLKSTDLTIQEIATRLNFSNQSFFGKYFKHLTGMSPLRFRRMPE